MMQLRSSSASPFVRKIRIGAAVLGLADRIEIVPADTSDHNDNLRTQNPLGKIPTLMLEDGRALYDSAVILEYFDSLAGGDKLIPSGDARFHVLTRAALADGIAEAAILRSMSNAGARKAPAALVGSTIRPARSAAASPHWKLTRLSATR
jgi:glutathione S-transferase